MSGLNTAVGGARLLVGWTSLFSLGALQVGGGTG